MLPHHRITSSIIWLAPLPPHQSVIWLAHCHHISQSFELPSTTTSLHDCVTASPHHCHHITTSPHYLITVSPHYPIRSLAFSHLTCPLPPHQSFELPSTTMSLHHQLTMLVSHLTCPLPPHQSVIWIALYHCITTLLYHPITVSLPHCVRFSPPNWYESDCLILPSTVLIG